jgi:hypothetical protein
LGAWPSAISSSGASHGEHLLLSARKRSGGLLPALPQPGELREDAVLHVVEANAGERRHAEVLDDREVREELADLESAREAELHAPVLGERGGAFLADVDVSTAGRERAGQQVDESGLARAVGPDERVARALREREAHVAHGGERTEAAREVLGAQRGAHRRILSIAPMIPPRAKNTNTTSSRPSQNCQYTGLIPER